MAAFFASGCLVGHESGQRVYVTEVRCDHQVDPLGVGEAPGLGWILEANRRGASQTAYEIQVATSGNFLAKGEADVWDSGKVLSGESAFVPYAGKALNSQTHYFWRVRVWNERGEVSPWSKQGHWATGMLGSLSWKGSWISGRTNGNYTDAPSFWFRKSFDLNEPITSALCSVASVGYHELYVNGKKVGNDVMAPALSDLSKRALAVTRDLAPYLRRGKNTIAIWLGEGWAGHSGRMWFSGSDLGWSREPQFLLEASLRGPEKDLEISSGSDWKCHRANTDSTYPTNYHNLGGELQDDRAFIAGWNTPDFDESGWPAAITRETPLEVSPQIVQCNESYGEDLSPAAIKEVKPGVYQADMGRQFSGWIQLTASGTPGAKIGIDMSERPEDASSYGQENAWIMGPGGRGKFSNHFKHQAGRWITVRGLSSPLQASQLHGIPITTGYERTGHFSCSSDFYNRLYETTLWTFRQLTLDGYLVDCPHRERMGYGDGINGVQTAMSSFDVAPLFRKWARDWSDVQQPDGNVPFTAPTYNGGGGPMWSSTLVHLPWLIYLYYGDPRPMRDEYPAIRRWMAFLQSKSVNHILQFHTGPKNVVQPEWSFLGDWVYPGHQQAPNGHDRETLFMNNCYYLRTLKTAARIADALGRLEDGRRYRAEAEAAARAIHEEFWDAKAQSYPGGRETTPASALFADLPPANVRPLVVAQLETRIRKKGALDTGILGTYFLIQALIAEHRNDLADIIASRQEYPGWGYMLAHGATCLWEQWDGNNSRCHSSFLSIGDWFIEGIAGIRPDPSAPGFRHFFIEPGPCGNLTNASADMTCGYGKISASWRIENREFALDVEIPVNTTATVSIPGMNAKERPAVAEVGSGRYHFTSRMQ